MALISLNPTKTSDAEKEKGPLACVCAVEDSHALTGNLLLQI